MKRIIPAFLVMTILATATPAQRLSHPDGIFYYEPAAGVYGGPALWTNPAALGGHDGDEIQIIGDYRASHWFKDKGFLVSRKRIGLAYRSLSGSYAPKVNDWIVGCGFEMGAQLLFGSSFSWISSGPAGFDGRTQWSVALLRRDGGPFSFGAVAGNLNRYKVAGQRSETELRYSLGYRPLGDKITFSADALLTTKTRFKNSDFVYHIVATPSSGLYLSASVDSHRNFEFGARVNLLRNFIGSKMGLDRHGDHRGTTVYLGTTSLRQPSVVPESPKRLIVPLSSFGSENPARPLFGKSGPAFVDLILTLYRAAHDDAVKEVLFTSDELVLSLAQVQEVRSAIEELKARGKRVQYYDNSPGNRSYYLASAADEIIIPPVCQVNLVGLRAELTFYAGTMERLGVRADMLRIGEYKTAVEPYTQTAATEANKEQLNRILDDLFGQLTQGIARGRGISADSVKFLIDQGPFTSKEAKEAGLVDRLDYFFDFTHGQRGGFKSESFSSYFRDTVVTGSWIAPPRFAVVVAEGEIMGQYNPGSPLDNSPRINARTIAAALERAQRDRRVKGIVLRVDSPGGDALASDQISQSVLRAAKKKSLVVSMGGDAASGGYYISIPANKIFASPGSITGSIGIFGGKVDLSGLNQKIGLGKELFTRGKYAGWLSSSRPFTDEERSKYLHHLTAFYDQFVSFAGDYRKLSVDSVDHIGRGQVWTGREAVVNGLVDEPGGLWQALEYLREQSGSARYGVDVYPRRRTLFGFTVPRLLQAAARIVGGSGSTAETDILSALEPDIRIQARVPYDLDIQ